MAAKEILVKKYVVRLNGEERERLETLIRERKEPGLFQEERNLGRIGRAAEVEPQHLYTSSFACNRNADRYDGC